MVSEHRIRAECQGAAGMSVTAKGVFPCPQRGPARCGMNRSAIVSYRWVRVKSCCNVCKSYFRVLFVRLTSARLPIQPEFSFSIEA